MRSVHRRSALALLALVLAATGCGIGTGSTAQAPAVSPSSPGASPAALREVLAATQETMGLSASVRLEQVGIAGGLASPSSKPVGGSGVVDFAKGDGGEIFLEPAGIEQLVFEPNAVYDQPASAAGNQAVVPQGKRWLGSEPTDHGSYQFSMETLRFEGSNPVFLLELVGWGATSAARIGEQTINSEQTTEYQLMVDPHVAATRATGPTAAAFAATLGYQNPVAALAASATKLAPALAGRDIVSSAITMEAWVNNVGRVVQLQASPPGTTGGQITMTMTKFGVSVTTAPPPASQILDLGAAISFSESGDGDLS